MMLSSLPAPKALGTGEGVAFLRNGNATSWIPWLGGSAIPPETMRLPRITPITTAFTA